MRLLLERIPEENQDVDLIFRDARADLLVAAQRAAQHLITVYRALLQQLAGGASRIENVLAQRDFVKPRPFQQIILLMIMRDQRDALQWFHFDCLSCHKSLYLVIVQSFQ